MTTSRIGDECLGDVIVESWVDVCENPTSPAPSNNPEDYLRLLREAQRESNQSSALVSLASTRKNSPRSTPKSPPNSPNTEPVTEGEELKGFYINYCTNKEDVNLESTSDWVWDWSSRPEQQPPKEWKFVHPEGRSAKKPYGYTIRFAKVGGTSVFSRHILYTMVLTNLISLLLGTGIGFWLSRRSSGAIIHLTLMD